MVPAVVVSVGVVTAGEDVRDGTDPEDVEAGALTGVLEHAVRSITERARDSEPKVTTRRTVVTSPVPADYPQRVGARLAAYRARRAGATIR